VTALGALSCTDGREWPALYLNAHPWQRCDAHWKRQILPPAIIGAIFWCVAFPVASTLLLRRLHRRLASGIGISAAAAAAGAGATAPANLIGAGLALQSRPASPFPPSALSAWSLSGGLLSPFAPRLWYWEQILLLRRLSLAAAVALIPAHSIYLPLALLALVQMAALLQHWARPFTHKMLNSAELASLYLLLINYISALVLQAGGGAGDSGAGSVGQSAPGWTALLLAANLLFILALVAALFAFARRAAQAGLQRAEGWLRPLLQRLGLGGGAEGAADSSAAMGPQPPPCGPLQTVHAAIDVDDAASADAAPVGVRPAAFEMRVAASSLYSPPGRAPPLLVHALGSAPPRWEITQPLLQNEQADL
jgi:hypothetical protein